MVTSMQVSLLSNASSPEKKGSSRLRWIWTLITVQNDHGREPVFLVRVVDGTFQAHYYNSEQKAYLITNQTDKARVVYVEHPLREGWRLADDSPRPVDKTQTAYRFKVELGPHESWELKIAERQALMDTYSISNLTPGDLDLFISRRYLDDVSRAALEKIIGIKERIGKVEGRLAAIQHEIG